MESSKKNLLKHKLNNKKGDQNLQDTLVNEQNEEGKSSPVLWKYIYEDQQETKKQLNQSTSKLNIDLLHANSKHQEYKFNFEYDYLLNKNKSNLFKKLCFNLIKLNQFRFVCFLMFVFILIVTFRLFVNQSSSKWLLTLPKLNLIQNERLFYSHLFKTDNKIDGQENFLSTDDLSTFEKVITVDTECRKYVGLVEDGAFAFKGIQYAVPPVNSLRWQRTVPIWKSSDICKPNVIHKATHFTSCCAQINPFTKHFEGTEDCLYLNIWTPRLDNSADLNVMIWFHSGFLQFGSGNYPKLSPNGKLAKKLNTIFVSFNYRLDGLGFLTLDKLSKTGPNSSLGNYGLFDQLVAVQWVKRNIFKFGGNPNKIIVFGSDGGAASILALASYVEFNEAINKIWLSGPSLFYNQSFETAAAKHHNQQLFKQESGCTNNKLDCLYNLTSKQVLNSFLTGDDPSFRINDQNDLPIQGIYSNQWIVIDDELVNDAYPFNNSINYNKLSFLIGTTAQAIEFWPGPTDLRNWSWSEYQKYVGTSLDSFNPKINQKTLSIYSPPNSSHLYTKESNQLENKNLISSFQRKLKIREKFNNTNGINLNNKINQFNLPLNLQKSNYKQKKIKKNFFSKQVRHLDSIKSINLKFNETPESLYTKMVTDIKQTCPVNLIAKNLAKYHNSNVYRYVVTSRPSSEVTVFNYPSKYSFHLWDMIAFFGQIEAFISEPTKEDYDFEQQMQDVVLKFISQPAQLYDRQGNIVEDKNDLNQDYKKYSFWSTYPNLTALISNKIDLVFDYNSKECNFWDEMGLSTYAWIC